MNYYFNKTVKMSFEDAEIKVIEALKSEGFGVLTEIDVQATLKKKLDVDFRRYKILGACNPPFAYKALQAEDKIGLLLPCNIVIQEKSDKTIEVAAINPLASMEVVGNEKLTEIAKEVQSKLNNVIKSI
ncbi:MAG: hypothetical protein A2X08_09060 [Bacteroidetes bacterium GWA2_32_17]|nr:MAG: hypothetical protein A2X08_09060 [Bacteroidetes bacterium GWA2_32_17]